MMTFRAIAITALLTSSLQVQATPLASWTESTWNNAFLSDVLMNDKKEAREERRAKSKAACEGKQAGDSCQFEGKKRTVQGTCQKNRKDELMCRGNKKPKN
ncbi:hypothetical protein [Candidatus Albibeggiatoa sp. nov. NOAA]|uniref:hypothetical protein n=1 Tax=Candidatus Albibeggiatoa sp. nov. NOAA TaxID=3162724 RepID=UPI0032FAD6D9|nr:hypothetical protein [Thiotrichaceae bacterium]